MIVLVCGGRDFSDRVLLTRKLDKVHSHVGITLLIHGAQRGADTLADEWAKERGIPRKPFAANWRVFGSLAGPMRNDRMLREGQPELVVAFAGGPGTEDMVNKATYAGVTVLRAGKLNGMRW